MSYIFTERGLSWTEFSKYFHPRYYDGCTFWKSFKLWLKLAKQQIISKCQSAYLCTWLFHQIFLSHLKFWKILISAKAKRHRILQIHDTSLGIWLSCRFTLRTKWRWGFAVIFLEIYFTNRKYHSAFPGKFYWKKSATFHFPAWGWSGEQTFTRLTLLKNQNWYLTSLPRSTNYIAVVQQKRIMIPKILCQGLLLN